MIDLFFRCASRDRWLTVAKDRNILDKDGNPNPGFAVDELGHVTITPAVLDKQGNVTTPAVVDTWWSINLRVHGQQADDDTDEKFAGETDDLKFTKSKLVRFVREQGTQITLRGMRAYQFGAAANRVQLIDPRDMPNPPRVWLGGMSI